MSEQKFLELCRWINTETDRKKRNALIDELYQLLVEEQDEIKAKINRNLSNLMREPE